MSIYFFPSVSGEERGAQEHWRHDGHVELLGWPGAPEFPNHFFFLCESVDKEPEKRNSPYAPQSPNHLVDGKVGITNQKKRNSLDAPEVELESERCQHRVLCLSSPLALVGTHTRERYCL